MRGLPYNRARNVHFGLGGMFNLAGRPTHIEASRKTMQEDCCHHHQSCGREENENEGQRSRVATGKAKALQDSSCGQWHWGVDARLGGSLWCGAKMKWFFQTTEPIEGAFTHSGGSQGQRRHRQQRAPRVPREPSGGSPSSGGDSLDRQSEH